MTHEASPSQVELIEEIGKVLEGITPEPWEYRLRLLRAAREHMKKCGSCFALTEEIRKREEAEAKLASAQEEIARQSALVEKYAAAARVIGLHLREFCDDSLPYDEMIADASRKVAEELAANRACNRYTWKERAERAEQSLREKDAEIERLRREKRDAEADGWCDACCGTGKPADGSACMCGGTGKAAMAVTYLRERMLKQERESAERERTLREALADTTAMCRSAATWPADDTQGMRFHALEAAKRGAVALSLESPAQEDR